VRVSNGTWYIRNAAVPEGWPELTPVGEVEVKPYPVYRAATVTETDLSGAGMQPMFMELFRHIKDNDIAMTAPVAMTYADGDAAPAMSSMAFLYRRPDQGVAGTDGPVRIEDLEAHRFASVGMRGGYTAETYTKGLGLLRAWLEAHPEWRATGGPRFLGYNGPFVPVFMRYGEVQIPVVGADGA
jgi:hypothetical protein